jgi:hypothetical protein
LSFNWTKTNTGATGATGTGEKGDTIGITKLYTRNNDTSTPGTPTVPTSNPVGWSTSCGEPNSTYKYVWSVSAQFEEDSKNNRTYTAFETPELYMAHYPNVDPYEYAEFCRLTNFGENDFIGRDEKTGRAYINASYINTGALTVTKGGNGADKGEELFSAGWDKDGKGIVRIGNMSVGDISSKLIGKNYVKGSKANYATA